MIVMEVRDALQGRSCGAQAGCRLGLQPFVRPASPTLSYMCACPPACARPQVRRAAHADFELPADERSSIVYVTRNDAEDRIIRNEGQMLARIRESFPNTPVVVFNGAEISLQVRTYGVRGGRGWAGPPQRQLTRAVSRSTCPCRAHLARAHWAAGAWLLHAPGAAVGLPATHVPTPLVPYTPSRALQDTIKVFKSAKLVLGGHGAGMVHSIFCASDVPVVELLFSHRPHLHFFLTTTSLARVSRQRRSQHDSLPLRRCTGASLL